MSVNKRLKFECIAALHLSSMMLLSCSSIAEEYDLSALMVRLDNVDINNEMLGMPTPGEHRLSVLLNGQKMSLDVLFIPDDKNKSKLCLMNKDLVSLGVNIKNISDDFYDADSCLISVEGIFSFVFKEADYHLNIYVSPKLMLTNHEVLLNNVDNGIAGVGWSYNGNVEFKKNVYEQSSLNNKVFASIGDWRANANVNILHHKKSDVAIIDSGEFFLYRNYIDEGTYLSVGELRHTGSVFNNKKFWGISYMSDKQIRRKAIFDRLDYFPGYAKDDARVTLFQAGIQICQFYVSKGTFNLQECQEDLFLDTELSIEYAPEDIEHYILPATPFGRSLESGESTFAVKVGNFTSGSHEPFINYEYSHGITANLLADIGFELTPSTISFGAGVTYANSLGIFTLNKKYDKSTYDTYAETKATYQKTIPSLKGNIFASYSFGDTYMSSLERKNSYNGQEVVFFSQSSSDWPSTRFSFERRNYKGKNKQYMSSFSLYGTTDLYQYEFNQTYRKIKSNTSNGNEFHFEISVSFPFDFFDNNFGGLVSKRFSVKNPGETKFDLYTKSKGDFDLSGSIILDDKADFSYGNFYYTEHLGATQARFSYSSPFGGIINTGIGGGIVLTEYGAIFTEHLMETSMIAHIEDVEGVMFNNARGAVTDKKGFAIIPLTPFTEKSVTIDEKSIPDGFQIANLVAKKMAPKGAFIYSRFDVENGGPILVKISNNNLINVPFGASIYLDERETKEYANGNGTFFISSFPVGVSKITIKWLSGECSIDMSSEPEKSVDGMLIFSEECTPK